MTYGKISLLQLLAIALALLALIFCMPGSASAIDNFYPVTGNMTIAPTSTGIDFRDVQLNGFFVNAPLLYVNNNDSVYVIDTSTNKVIDTINVSDGNMIWAVAVSPDYSRLYIVYLDGPQYTRNHYETSYIDTIDLKTKTVIRTDYIPTLGRVEKILMSNDGGRLYILTKYPTMDALYVYDTVNGKFIKTLYFSSLYQNDFAEMFDMALSQDGKRLYFANLNHMCVNVIETSTFKLDKIAPGYSYGTYKYKWSSETWDWRFDVRFYGVAVTPDCSKIYLSNGFYYLEHGSYVDVDHTSPRITVFDAYDYDPYDDSYQKIVETFDVPGRLVMSPDGSYLYAVDPESAAVRGFLTQTDQEYRSYGTGKYPVDIAITPDGSRIYTANSGADTVTVINAPTLTYCPPGSIKVGFKPYALFMGKIPAGPIFINTSGSKNNLRLSHVNLSYSLIPLFNFTNNSTGPSYTLPVKEIPAFTIIPGQIIEIQSPDNETGDNTVENGTATPTTTAGNVSSADPTDVSVATPGNQTATPVAVTPGPGIIAALLSIVVVAYRAYKK